ncbi:ROK family protein [Arthrobacter sp. PAMC25284]|uniref:ROK family protein n=1 Tax=Arthrobacter sp. PAMC25284 TaxID=2861279 RepID=UPI001C63A752|nr:ROK family protein [Arthrobacter sp. PAMC25284]QYF90947.1 ROK family protein [Arthrobacter sp. PAMC25284]
MNEHGGQSGSASGPAVLAFDVGGTDMKAGIVLATGRIIGLRRMATPRHPVDTGGAVIEKITEVASEYRGLYPGHPVRAAGLIVPGLVDEATGTGILSANLGWKDFPFAERAQAALGLPVAFGHDVGSAGEAEFRFGAARGASNAVVLVIGTGIAGAVFVDDRRLTGGGYAGELGHAPVPDPDRPGSTTILEAVGSAGAIASRYCAATGRSVDGARQVLDLAAAGDPEAYRVWSEAVDALAFSIVQCVSILGTETVVMGGGLSQAGEALLAPLRTRVENLLSIHRRPRIVPATLGQDAGLIGSALKARELLSSIESNIEAP